VKTTPIKLKNSLLKICFYSYTIPPRVLKKKGTLTWFSQKDMLGQNGILDRIVYNSPILFSPIL
jgi:hypothetical protein